MGGPLTSVKTPLPTVKSCAPIVYLLMEPEPNGVHENDNWPTIGVNGQQATLEGTDDKTKRHPRWTRKETLILIEGKQVAENRGQRSHRSSSVFGSDQLESKWDAVSSFCREHGVNRGPVQCRKRWSNLVSDFRKIKTWEPQVKEEVESFWLMRNDSRREKKLPGFFDREIYDVLDGKAFTAMSNPQTLATTTGDTKYVNGPKAMVEEEEDEEEEDAETLFDSGRCVAAEDGLFSDVKQLAPEENGRSQEKQTGAVDTPTKTVPAPMPISGMTKGKQPGLNFERTSLSQEGWKRRRLPSDGTGDMNLEGRLIKVLEKNSSMLKAHLEAQNINYQLDKEQRKDQIDSFVAAVSKITDAIGKIADKL